MLFAYYDKDHAKPTKMPSKKENKMWIKSKTPPYSSSEPVMSLNGSTVVYIPDSSCFRNYIAGLWTGSEVQHGKVIFAELVLRTLSCQDKMLPWYTKTRYIRPPNVLSISLQFSGAVTCEIATDFSPIGLVTIACAHGKVIQASEQQLVWGCVLPSQCFNHT